MLNIYHQQMTSVQPVPNRSLQGIGTASLCAWAWNPNPSFNHQSHSICYFNLSPTPLKSLVYFCLLASAKSIETIQLPSINKHMKITKAGDWITSPFSICWNPVVPSSFWTPSRQHCQDRRPSTYNLSRGDLLCSCCFFGMLASSFFCWHLTAFFCTFLSFLGFNVYLHD